MRQVTTSLWNVCQGTGCSVQVEQQCLGSASISPGALSAAAFICIHSIGIDLDLSNRRRASHCIPTKILLFCKAGLAKFQIDVFVLCLCLKSCLSEEKWLSLCWSWWFSEAPPGLNSTWRIIAVCDTVLIERELPQSMQLTHFSEKHAINVSEVAWLLLWD